MFPVIPNVGHIPLCQGYAGNDDFFRPFFAEPRQHAFCLRAGQRHGTIRLSQQNTGLSKVGGDYVRDADQLHHPPAHFRSNGAVRFAMVSHNRVYYRQRVGVSFEKGETVVDLGLGTQKTGINTGKIQPQPLIVGKSLGKIIGQVLKSDFAEPSGMSGENGSGNRAGLYPHSGQDRHDYCQRAAPHAG